MHLEAQCLAALVPVPFAPGEPGRPVFHAPNSCHRMSTRAAPKKEHCMSTFVAPKKEHWENGSHAQDAHTHTHTYKRACSSQPATRAAATPGSMTARPGLLASSQQFSSPSPFGVRAGRARQSSGLVGASIPSPGALVRAARAAGRCNCTGLCIDSFPDALVRAARAAGCFSCIRLCKFSFACARPTSTAGKCQGLH